MLNLHPEISREAFEGFSKEGLGYRLLRVPVDSCDFSLETYDSLVEKEPVKVAAQRAGKYIFPMLKDIFAVCEEPPEIMVSPWSPPEYMKTNGQRQWGGHLKKEYLPVYPCPAGRGLSGKTNVHSERGKRSTEMGFLPVQCRGGERVSENSSLSCAEKTWAG